MNYPVNFQSHYISDVQNKKNVPDAVVCTMKRCASKAMGIALKRTMAWHSLYCAQDGFGNIGDNDTNNTHFLHALAAVQHALRTITMLRTERDGFAREFGLQNIVNVRNQVALPLMHEE